MIVFEHAGVQRKHWEENGHPLVAMLQEKQLETQTYSRQDSKGESKILFSSGPSSKSITHDDIATLDQAKGAECACTCVLYVYGHAYFAAHLHLSLSRIVMCVCTCVHKLYFNELEFCVSSCHGRSDKCDP